MLNANRKCCKLFGGMWLLDLARFIAMSICEGFLSIIIYCIPVDASPLIAVVMHLAQGTYIMLTFL